jgi:hypothetical protein
MSSIKELLDAKELQKLQSGLGKQVGDYWILCLVLPSLVVGFKGASQWKLIIYELQNQI